MSCLQRPILNKLIYKIKTKIIKLKKAAKQGRLHEFAAKMGGSSWVVKYNKIKNKESCSLNT
jgi:hypothetical protein